MSQAHAQKPNQTPQTSNAGQPSIGAAAAAAAAATAKPTEAKPDAKPEEKTDTKPDSATTGTATGAAADAAKPEKKGPARKLLIIVGQVHEFDTPAKAEAFLNGPDAPKEFQVYRGNAISTRRKVSLR
jgi:hypothetical protein